MIRFSILSLAALMLLSFPRHIQAGEPVPKSAEEARKQFETADAELNKVYRRVYLGADVQSQDSLQKAQRLWLQCRDLTAGACQTGESSRHRVDDQYFFYARTLLTRNRTKELLNLFPPQGLKQQGANSPPPSSLRLKPQ